VALEQAVEPKTRERDRPGAAEEEEEEEEVEVMEEAVEGLILQLGGKVEKGK
jgi:hypothetical protein